MLQAVTFDLWDTLFADNSDEPRRAALGLPDKASARRALFVAVATRHHAHVSVEAAVAAFDQATAWSTRCWKQDHRTPTVAERLEEALRLLHLGRPPGFDAMVDALERMEVDLPPDPAPGAADAVRALAPHFKLGIISDTIVTPGRLLRQLLGDHGMLEHFSAFVFSDEVGAAKPSRAVFQAAEARLGVPAADIVHVGDREANDVLGPKAVGMRAILYTGVVDRGGATTAADALCQHHQDLPSILHQLSLG